MVKYDKLQVPKNQRMAAIKSKNSKIELTLRRALWSKGLRYYTHYNVTGKPDIVFSKKKLAIFVDSHFWHGYDWKNLKKKLKNEFWFNKISTNIKRDAKVNKVLKSEGWTVMRFWEHEIKDNLESCVNDVSTEYEKKK